MKPFLIDPHVHTAEVSSCSHLPAAELVRLYGARDYDAVIVTDHYAQQFFNRHDIVSLLWPDQIGRFLDGYHRAHRAGQRVGLQVFLGLEVTLIESGNDYLIYGFDEQELEHSPPLYSLSLADLHSLVHHHEGIVVQAHPFRPGCTPADPSLLDGVETFNGNPRHSSRNHLAQAYAHRHNLRRLSGSDAHMEEDVGRGGMRLPYQVDSLKAWLDVIDRSELLSTAEAA